jgi:thioredoxin 1
VFSALEARAAGKVEFAKLNVDLNPMTASRYRVLAIPTAILFADGEPRETVVGARTAAHYERAWATWLTPAE